MYNCLLQDELHRFAIVQRIRRHEISMLHLGRSISVLGRSKAEVALKRSKAVVGRLKAAVGKFNSALETHLVLNLIRKL